MVNNVDLEKALESFQKKYTVNEETGCWEWSGALGNGGYGQFGIPLIDGTYVSSSAHKFAYELKNGVVPKGLVIRHKCHRRNCVNPDHLSVGTNADNQMDRKKRVFKEKEQYEKDLAWLMGITGIKTHTKAHRLALRLLRRTISDSELKTIVDAARLI